MKRKIVSGIILTLLTVSTLTLAFNTQPVKSDWTWTETVYIRADGSVDPSTAPISSVDNVTYTFTDNIYDSIVIERDNIVVDGAGYTLQGTGSGKGIDLWNRNNVTIKNLKIKEFKYGIYLTESYNNTISSNNITNNWSGIYLFVSSDNRLSENIITNNNFGVYVEQSSSNVVSRNKITANKWNGITLDSSPLNMVADNNIATNKWHGLDVIHSSNNVIYQNKITANNLNGVVFGFSSHNTLSRNNLTMNSYDGINLGYSSNYTIFGNTVIANKHHGIRLHDSSSSNNISGNNIRANNYYGIGLSESSSNTVSGNNIANNEYCIWLYKSSNNSVYHNNFIDNTQQVYIYSAGYANVWDDGYPSGGNYWSDYSGVDSNSDGIGDTPYTIDASNQDRYPLMNPWIERKVGVKVGDWAKYNVGVSWTGVLHQMFSAISETKWLMIEATDISDTEVTFTGTLHFKNDTEQVTTGVKWDIAPTGSYGIILFFIGSNLKQHDKIYPISTYTINETVSRTYNGVPRENNHLNVSTSYVLTPPAVYDIYRLDCYWDKATGILTEETLEMSQDDLSRSLSIHLKIIDTNLWEAPVPTTIGELKTEIEELGSEGEIDNQGLVKSLIAKLNVVQRLVDKGKMAEAKSILEDDFIPQVQNLSGIHIKPEAADILIQSAEYILSQL